MSAKTGVMWATVMLISGFSCGGDARRFRRIGARR